MSEGVFRGIRVHVGCPCGFTHLWMFTALVWVCVSLSPVGLGGCTCAETVPAS